MLNSKVSKGFEISRLKVLKIERFEAWAPSFKAMKVWLGHRMVRSPRRMLSADGIAPQPPWVASASVNL